MKSTSRPSCSVKISQHCGDQYSDFGTPYPSQHVVGQGVMDVFDHIADGNLSAGDAGDQRGSDLTEFISTLHRGSPYMGAVITVIY